MKKLTLVSLLLVLCILFSACGAVATDSITESATNEQKFYSAYGSENGVYYAATADDAGSLQMESTEYAPAEGQEEKLVYTSNVTLEAEDFDAASQTLHSTINSLGGIIVSENAYNLSNVGFRSLEMTVRIPQENYETFLSGLSSSYNVASIRNSVENFTEQYYDNESRLKSYRVQEERLFAMLEKAETVEDMLDIEERLCNVQYQIESLTNTKNTIDNDVRYATFYLNLDEVTKYTTPTPKTFGDRLGETVSESGEMFAEFLEGLLFAIIFMAPYLVIIAVITVIVIVCVKRSKKKKARAAEVNKDEK
ncbi:MAG: DUF4349 domain-containing protein [Clostridia bacterium]|nr:DUF4349 domain-containing protein [Clostridia bacterium]